MNKESCEKLFNNKYPITSKFKSKVKSLARITSTLPPVNELGNGITFGRGGSTILFKAYEMKYILVNYHLTPGKIL